MSQSKPKVLTHYDSAGHVRMVDVSLKRDTVRKAVAEAHVRMRTKALRAIRQNPKGDPLEIARIAGISAAKKTAELIPLCHTLLLTHVDVDARVIRNGIRIISEVRSTGGTGVEMEALTAAAVAGLTIYDMCKAVDRGIEIGGLRLLEKSGGKSGRYIRKQKAESRKR
ncbi:MAG TPA: cyclic pyranopterin monophosphate synthase MoaC [Terriglobia bacterium]|nr:cyclic pyranopterin monophosphate synthase MoaC [Terriglobia bacterium]